MRRVYVVLRILAYLCGAVGALLAVTGKRSGDPEAGRTLFVIGAGLLVVMFVLFTASYGVFLVMRFSRPVVLPPRE
ncbi:MAG: hypothetical protein U1E27_08080 [Kiritimatiellia bacterium]|nr:hypothetical protein [Kiritimatiellia bacterium]